MRKILFVGTLLILICQVFGAFPIGSNTFFATFIMTNSAYGSGAAFPCRVWFNGQAGLMRIDYFQPNGARFMSVMYNYTSGDKYEVCGTNCKRATWNARMPIFLGTASTYASTTCQTPDYPGPKACSTFPSCTSYLSNPNQPDGIYSLSYNDAAATQLCLVRWTPSSGQTYGPEWQIQTYLTSGFNSTTNPTQNSIYSSVIDGVTCPQPTCFAELDISLIVDESGSIFSANAWNDVQNFVVNLISSLDMAPNAIRVGLSYFSGLGSCQQNWTGTSITYGCNGGCSACGGRWQQLTQGVVTDKAGLIAIARGNTGARGNTCISCGLDIGIKTLNYAPKANVGKVIILFTDGAQNTVTGSLSTQGKRAYDMGIKVIAVATGGYRLSDLQAFTDTIYTTSSFNQLSNLISSIITPLCQPLPSIDTCDFCSGLCSCATTCNCPNCNDFNACTRENCDIRPPPQGTSGSCVSIPVICDDNNPCTVNNCLNATGCDYSTATTKPNNLQDTYCKRYICTNPQGFTLTDLGDTFCPQGNDKCIITYCNTTVGSTSGLTGSCQTINKTSTLYPYGSTITYVNSAGQSISTPGCGRPSSTVPCQVFSCNSTDGSCIASNSACQCLVDSDCNDGNGCTTDVCDIQNNRCLNTPKDCWSDLSNGNCRSITGNQTALVATSEAGNGFYNGSITFSLNGNLPSIQSTCDRLACFGGQRNQYTCSSTGNNTYSCIRQVTNCQSSACSDSTCRSLGSWTNTGSFGQANTDCGNIKSRTCADSNACTSDICNSAFSGTACSQTSCQSQTGVRCSNPSNATNCNLSDVCKTYSCNISTGCQSTSLPTPTPNFCFVVGCDPVSGNFSRVNTTACSPDADKCIIRYCDTAASGGTGACAQVNKRTLFQNQTATFVDAFGVTQSFSGCFQSHPCIIYGCNATSGLCTVDSSNCNCTSDAQCDDGNGCTDDSCVTNNCVNTLKDCYSELSNGNCVVNQVISSGSNATGLENYYQGSPVQTFVAGSYSCDKLVCFSGQRSQYSCQSTGNFTHQCVRTTANCAKGGCADSICTSKTTWTNGQLDTDCSTVISPTCTSNQCFTAACNTAFVYGSNQERCLYTDIGSLCDDNNPCTLNQCNNDTGCDYNTKSTQPKANTTCINYQCDTQLGWQPVDVGRTACPDFNTCDLQYCNTTSDTCVTIKKGELTTQQTVTYVDSDGITKSVTGCATPNDPVTCRIYRCDANNGGVCVYDTSNCICQKDEDCEDGNGCTVDTCNFAQNRCIRTNIDCFSILSNGTCTQGSTYAADTSVGLSIYNGSAPSNNVYTQVDSNGLPFPATGVPRTCAQLGCYNGQTSQYSCLSIKEKEYKCLRTSLNCSRNGCQDNICRTLGTWGTLNNTGQIDSDCGTTFQPFCADNNACTNDYCNSAWTPAQPVSERCLHTQINGSQFCDDGNYCTLDYCDNQDTSGNVCKHSLYSDSYVKKYLCKNGTVCQNVKCTVNRCVYGDISCVAPTLCIFFTCNATTSGICKPFPTGLYSIDKCGVCGGNGLSCVPIIPGNPKKTSIAVALGVGLGIGLFVAALIIAAITKKSFDAYNALAVETQGTVTNSPTYQGGENHIDTTHYGD
eukprot:TRINITY_DN0_c0_g2_i2.p1 TRINITY_DN0_c0_g2~~TRINITY_DN0_c0_g2_i2.p1  ORF type:complete len:1609 (+),score=374.09 TRINITY_DN0_c0_g2_i2:29-4828(+)